jgi:hypothetical protein
LATRDCRGIKVGILGLETNGLAERSIAADLLRALCLESGFSIAFDINLAFDSRELAWFSVAEAPGLDVLLVCLRATAAPLLAPLRDSLERRRVAGRSTPLIAFGGQTALAARQDLREQFSGALIWTGDIESAFPRILESLREKHPEIADSEVVARLDRLPPSRIAMPDQHSTARAVDAGGSVWVEASRGCKLNCSFCVLSNKSAPTHWRPRPIHELLDEIELIQNRFGILDFSFSDYSAFESDEYLEEFLVAIRQRQIKVTFRCDLRLGTARRIRRSLADLRQAGMCAIYVGIETVLPEYQRLYRKAYPGREIIDTLQALGVVVVAGFIMLDPFHSPQQFRTQITEVRNQGILELIATPFKTMRIQRGTEYEKVALERGIVMGMNSDLFSYSYHSADPRMEALRRVVEFFHDATTDIYYNPYIENFARQQAADPHGGPTRGVSGEHLATLGKITNRYREAEMRLLEELSELTLTASSLSDLVRSVGRTGLRFCRTRRAIFDETARDYEQLLACGISHYRHDLNRFLEIYNTLPLFHEDILQGIQA